MKESKSHHLKCQKIHPHTPYNALVEGLKLCSNLVEAEVASWTAIPGNSTNIKQNCGSRNTDTTRALGESRPLPREHIS